MVKPQKWSIDNFPDLPDDLFMEAKSLVLLRLKLQAPAIEAEYWEMLIDKEPNTPEGRLVWNAIIEAAVVLATKRGLTLAPLRDRYRWQRSINDATRNSHLQARYKNLVAPGVLDSLMASMEKT